MKHIKFLSLFVLIFIGYNIILAQKSTKLKDLLWRNDIKRMIENFGEEQLILKEKGETARRLEAQSYTESVGLRIQVFAGSNQNIAKEILSNIQALNLDSVYMVQEKNLFKVQMGNYGERREAEIMLDRLRYAGIENAWIVNATIHVAKPPMSREELKILKETDIDTSGLFYSIQLFVTNDLGKSKKLKNELTKTLSQEIWIMQKGSVWKILAGKFSDRVIAQQILDNIKSSGFPDAWITQVTH
jgi:hypothetical protein